MDITAATVGAPTAWNTYGLSGKGIGIAVIDSGVSSNGPGGLNRKSHVVYERFFRSDTTTDDLAGHGTHVAGIIASDGGIPRAVALPARSGALRLAPTSSTSPSWIAIARATTAT